MKKILIFVGMFVLAFSLVSCGGGGGGNSYMYEVILDVLGDPTCPVGEGREFLVKLIKNGKEVDPGDVTISTFKDSGIGQLRIWNDGGTIDIKSDKITKKYGEITGCKVGAVSGAGQFGLTATYQGITIKETLSTN
ncbi:MAG: hypothetical protein IKN42_04845 [Elusimicrobia bacterium]|nr:hypothetical protein [Elusimicrobiota bacterium]